MRKKYEILEFNKDELKIDNECIGYLCYIGIPMGLQYSITAIGSVILQAAVNGLGSTVVASVSSASKIITFLCCPFDALGSTMATYAGQNSGARKPERISEGLKASIIIGSVYSGIALVVSILFGNHIALLFVNSGELEIISQVSLYLIVNSIFFIPLCLVNTVRFTIQGMGFSIFAILAGVCEMVARGLCGFAIVPTFGYIAVCLASPIAWIFADVFLIPAYKIVLRKLNDEGKNSVLSEKAI